MKRFSDDYGLNNTAWAMRHVARRPLTRAQAARVIAEPLPKRATGHGKGNAGHLASERAMPGCVLHIAVWLVVLSAWALAWLIAFAS